MYIISTRVVIPYIIGNNAIDTHIIPKQVIIFVINFFKYCSYYYSRYKRHTNFSFCYKKIGNIDIWGSKYENKDCQSNIPPLLT